MTDKLRVLESMAKSLGNSVIQWAADEIARLTAERDAAIRERRAANEEVEDWSRRCARALDARDAAIAERDAALVECGRFRARVAELEAAPPPRGWLTAEERGALKRAFDLLCDDDGDQPLAGTVQQLLARSSPPMVNVPTWIHDDVRRCVIAAIRAAGGEVEG